MELQTGEKRRLRQRNETRRTIMDAAESLLVEGGYDLFSIRRLAARCGYTAPSIYHHFTDKTGLIDALVEARFAKLYERLRRVPQIDDPLENIRQLLLAFIRFGLRHPAHYQLLAMPNGSSRRPPPTAERIIELVDRPLRRLAESRNLTYPSLDAARQTAWVVAHGLVSLLISRPDYPWAKELIPTAVETLLQGLVNIATPSEP